MNSPLPWGQRPFSIVSSVLNVKALVGAFNQKINLVGAFSVVVQLHQLIVCSTKQHQKLGPSAPLGGNLELRNPQSNFSLFILLRCFYLLQVGKFVELSDIVTFKIIHFVQT